MNARASWSAVPPRIWCETRETFSSRSFGAQWLLVAVVGLRCDGIDFYCSDAGLADSYQPVFGVYLSLTVLDEVCQIHIIDRPDKFLLLALFVFLDLWFDHEYDVLRI